MAAIEILVKYFIESHYISICAKIAIIEFLVKYFI